MEDPKPEDFLIELVCNARWIGDYCGSVLSEEIRQQYSSDVKVCEEMLNSLRQPLGHIEVISELPMPTVHCLCRGVAYLLCGEGLLSQVPPTMHHYLRQSQDRRADKAYETQLLVVRWFLSVGLISRDELERVLQGEMDSLGEDGVAPDGEDGGYSTEALTSMMAKALADPDPFYIGAHVVLTRALMVRHCSSIVGIDDIMGHAALLAPPEVSMEIDPHTLEDALLFWLRTTISLIDPASNPVSASASPVAAGGKQQAPPVDFQAVMELTHVDDLYLHTNDGRVLSLAIQQYRPDLLDSAKIHFYNPLTVWHRQGNWVNIINACEAMFLFVGVYPDEVVAHGFSRLQYHVIRIILELFAVMAMDTEKTFTSMCDALDTDTTFVQIRQSLAGYVSLQDPTSSENVVDMLNQPPMSARSKQEKSREVEHSNLNTPAEGNTPNDDGAGGAKVVKASSPPDQTAEGGASSHRSAPPPPLEDAEEYNVVLTGMFLQGMSIPLHQQQQKQQQAVPAPVPTTGGIDPVVVEDEEETTTFDIHQGGGADEEEESVMIESPPKGPSPAPTTTATNTNTGTSSYYDGATTTADTTGGGGGQGDTTMLQEEEGYSTTSSLAQAVDPAMRLFQSQLTDTSGVMAHSSNSNVVGVSTSSLHAAEPNVSASGPLIGSRSRLAQAADRNPARSISPDASASRDRRGGSGGGGMRNPLTASMAHFKAQRSPAALGKKHHSNSSGGGGTTNPLTSSAAIVQGSMDSQGIEELFAELAQLGDPSQVSNIPQISAQPGASPQETAKENAQLRNLLGRQQRQISGLIDKMRKKVKQQELTAIMQYIKTAGSKKRSDNATRKQASTGVSAATSTRGSFAARQLTPLSPNQVLEQGPPRPKNQVVVNRFEVSNQQQQQQQVPSEITQEPFQAPPPAATAPSSQPLPSQQQQQRDEEISPTLTEATQIAPSTSASARPSGMGGSLKESAPGPINGAGGSGASTTTNGGGAGPSNLAVPEQQRPGGNAFEISVGGLGKGKKQDPLSAPQLQKLKERHEERKLQARANNNNRGGVNLPALAKKNNKPVINNALRYACLPGQINKRSLENALAVVEEEDSQHLVVLLKDEFNHIFRGVYAEKEGKLQRVFGAGPLALPVPAASLAAGGPMIKFFRYDTGPKNFSAFSGKEWDGNVDAIAYCGGKIPKKF